jgi:hypothetical protein
MRSILSIWFIIGLFNIAFSQNPQINNLDNLSNIQDIQQILVRKKAFSNEYTNSYEGIEGSPYLQKDFIKGNIFTDNGTFSGVELRYDIYEGRFLVKLDGKIMYLDQPASIKKVELESISYFNKIITQLNVPKRVFLIRLFEGTVSLYAKKNVTLRPADPPKAIEAKASVPKFIKQPDSYFLQMGGGNIVMVENIKDFYQLFPAIAEELKDKVKSEKLSFKNQGDLLEIVKFCNTKI